MRLEQLMLEVSMPRIDTEAQAWLAVGRATPQKRPSADLDMLGIGASSSSCLPQIQTQFRTIPRDASAFPPTPRNDFTSSSPVVHRQSTADTPTLKLLRRCVRTFWNPHTRRLHRSQSRRRDDPVLSGKSLQGGLSTGLKHTGNIAPSRYWRIRLPRDCRRIFVPEN